MLHAQQACRARPAATRTVAKPSLIRPADYARAGKLAAMLSYAHGGASLEATIRTFRRHPNWRSA